VLWSNHGSGIKTIQSPGSGEAEKNRGLGDYSSVSRLNFGLINTKSCSLLLFAA
jgi:hypothetical protein